MHTSYSFFPSSKIKQNVPMKIFQRIQSNFALKCAHSKEMSLDALENKYNIVKIAKETNVGSTLDFLDRAAIACLLTTVLVPPLSVHATVVTTPVLFLVMSIIYTNLVESIDQSEQDMQLFRDVLDIPEELAECFQDV